MSTTQYQHPKILTDRCTVPLHKRAVDAALENFSLATKEFIPLTKLFLSQAVIIMHGKLDLEAILACKEMSDITTEGFAEQVCKDLQDAATLHTTGVAASLVTIPCMVWCFSWVCVEEEARNRADVGEAQLAATMASLGIGGSHRTPFQTERSNMVLDEVVVHYEVPHADDGIICDQILHQVALGCAIADGVPLQAFIAANEALNDFCDTVYEGVLASSAAPTRLKSIPRDSWRTRWIILIT